MPSVTLVTNVELSEDATRSFISEFSKFCSETIEKPEDNFIIDFSYNPNLVYRKTFEPAVRLEVISLRNTTPENVQRWTTAFFRFFEHEIGVPSNRGHFTFTDPGDEFVAVNGSTMAVLRAGRS